MGTTETLAEYLARGGVIKKVTHREWCESTFNKLFNKKEKRIKEKQEFYSWIYSQKLEKK